MKNTILFISLLALILTACSGDDAAEINITIINPDGDTNSNVVTISGVYTEDLTLDLNTNYVVNGSLIMAEGTTLTVPAGTIVRAAAIGSDVYIAIAQGARIIADGTADNPIVFTSNATNPVAGDWGGIILLGQAPINSTDGTVTSTSEIASLPYGGSDINDDSGILRYVRVEYSGASADGQSENNGFSFYGIGKGTVIEYIEAYEGRDDGIEFFGGTVDASYLVVVAAQDDSVDWTEGFSGTLNHIYIQHGGFHDKGLEADGYNTDTGNNSAPMYFSNPNVSNVTIKGLWGSVNTEAVRLRAGTQGSFSNFYIEGFEEGFDLDGDNGDNPTGNWVVSGDLMVNNVTFVNVDFKLQNDTGVVFSEADFISGDGNGTQTNIAVWGANWTIGL